MNLFEIDAEARNERGKSANRRLRHAGRVPGVLYGGGKDPQNIQVDADTLRKQLDHEAFFSHILNLNINGESHQVVLKDLQRDPATNKVVHLDLQRVSSTEELHMRVPLHFMNEEKSPGRKAGGVINHLLVDVEVACLPKDLPEYIEVDMAALDIGDALHLSDLKLPEGVRIPALQHGEDYDQAIVSVQHAQKYEEEELAAAEEGELAEGVEGEAAEGEAAEKKEEGEEGSED